MMIYKYRFWVLKTRIDGGAGTYYNSGDHEFIPGV